MVLAALVLGLAQIPDAFISGMRWRNIGPFRGGRVSAVTGVVGRPGEYLMGLPGGGVWKTTSGGTTWYPVFDRIKTVSAIGAIEVAPSDPKIVYAGTGDMRTGGAVCEGDGLYKSTDGGESWTRIGLENSHQIPSILVDPHRPEVVLVASLGDMRKASADRGLFRTEDGGSTWSKTLSVSDEVGVQKIAWAPDHPEVVLATTARHFVGENSPATGFVSGADESGTRLFISHDEGKTWTRIVGHGLPSLTGRTCVAIANGTNAQRMYIVGNFGLYRSDDGGLNWRAMDRSDRRVMNGQGGYNCGVYVNPKNPDVVYVVNTCLYRSVDGGETFTGFKGAPGGDDPQQLWLDPTDGDRIFLGSDQGATVTLDGGLNWTSWYNQPTAQVYHISVDRQWPYWVYATQQDSGSVATASRGNLGAITSLDWLPHPAYEFGSIVTDPLDSRISYAGGPGGGIVKTTYPSGQWIEVSPRVDPTLNLQSVRNQPLVFSPTNPRELFAGFQFLFSTTDGGRTWRKLSPNVGAERDAPAPPAKPTAAPLEKKGQIQNSDVDEDDDMDEDDVDGLLEKQFGANSGSIETVAPSPINGDLVWVGTTNGRIQLTRDHGRSWTEVSIKGLANIRRGDVACVEASHFDPGTAFAALDFHTSGDYRPHFFRTRDFGRTWVRIVEGLPETTPSGDFARVIREDPKRKGLVYAGTEASVYASFDDGDHWRSIALNAPATSYRDMVVKDDDLVVGTYGRSFWVLDDVSPLRQTTEATMREDAHLFEPSRAIRVRRNVNGDTPFPPEIPHAENAPAGAILYYSLGHAPKGAVEIRISDASGRVVRRLSSVPPTPSSEPEPPIPNFWVARPEPLTTQVGLNRTHWDLRYEAPYSASHNYEINANPNLTPPSPEGPLVAPGEYTVTLIVDGVTQSRKLTVVNDPRSPASPRDLRAQTDLQRHSYDVATVAHDHQTRLERVRTSIAARAESETDSKLKERLGAFVEQIASLRGSVGGGRRGFGGGGATSASFATVMSGALSALSRQEFGDMAPTEATLRVDRALDADLKKLLAKFDELRGPGLRTLNDVLIRAGKPAIEWTDRG